MRRSFLCGIAALAGVTTSPLTAQSAEAICADTVVSARIVSTGAVRAIITRMQDLRVCMAAEGFTDSLPFHPRDWATRSRLLTLETRVPGDVRRMQSSSVLTSWSKNGVTLANGETAAAWRGAVDELIAAQWDYAVQRIGRMELEEEIAGIIAQQNWIQGQIDTIRHKADSLRVQISEGYSRAQSDYAVRISRALQNEAALRSRLAEARGRLASIPRTPDNLDRVAAAEQSVRGAEDQVRQAVERTQAARAGAGDPNSGKQLLLDNLNPEGRIADLKSMLRELDADRRVANLREALRAFDAYPDPQPRLYNAAARIRAILTR
jgi:hypothetical protein